MSSTEEGNETQTEQITLEPSETIDFDIDGPEKQHGAAEPDTKKKGSKEPSAEVERAPGKTLLPFARVQKIIKADKDIPIVAKEATFLIAVATEEFIKRLTEAGQHVAHKEKRSTVQHRDIATVVRRDDEFLFLEDVLPWTSADPPAKRPKPAGKTQSASKGKDDSAKGDNAKVPKQSLLDNFVVDRGETEEDTKDVVMNEDGTMYAANIEEFDE